MNKMDMKIKESFDTTHDTTVMDILGSSGYSLETAMADIIDNSIFAGPNNIYLDFDYDGKNTIIKIIDDGKGMSIEKMKQACIIGYDYNEARDITDLGRFSAGLKTASRAIADHLIIQSVKEECNTISADFNKMNKVGWKCDIVEINDRFVESPTGTAIIWTNIKDNILPKTKEEFYDKIAKVETHLNHVFNDYIKEGLNIWINRNHKLEGWDPFCIDMGSMIIEEKNIPYKDSAISVKTYILPQYSNLDQNQQSIMKGYGLSEQQGFYIYRSKRLILEAGWLDIEGLQISNKFDYARIRIDIDNKLDKVFSTNYMKDKIFIPDDLVPTFKKIASKARSGSLKNYNYMKAPRIARAVKNDKVPVWNVKNSSHGLLLSVNENHPIIESICSKLNDRDKKRLFDLLSKNIPSSEISRNGVSSKQNEYQNIQEVMGDMYNALVEEGLTNDKIAEKMGKCEPFCLNNENMSMLIDFLSEKGII